MGVELTPELMRSRYVKPGAELVAPDNLLPHVAKTSGGRDKPIEFWGEIKIRNRQQLEVVEEISLRMLGIARPCSSTEEENEMGESFSHLKSIDLAGNLLSDWDDFLAIMKQFKNLQSISLASNRINDLNPTSIKGLSFAGITNLNLNSTNIGSFKTVQLIGEMMPSLEELCLAHCNLADIEECYSSSTGDDISNAQSGAFQSLVLLDLSDCHLTSWRKQIMPFHNLPELESLILNDNAIDIISIPDAETEAMFPKLASMQLAGTSIASWSALDGINKMSALRSLRLRNTPLTSSLGVGEVRSTAIARHPNLEFFNASPVSERERVEAERRYVSNVARELLMVSSGALLSTTEQNGDNTPEDDEVNAKKAQINTHHPRFQSLLEKHKETMMASTSAHGASGQGNIGDDVIGLTIRSMSAASCDMEPLRKRIPRSLKVGRIKAMCARAFGLDIDLQILHFRIEVSSNLKIVWIFDATALVKQTDLSFFSMYHV